MCSSLSCKMSERIISIATIHKVLGGDLLCLKLPDTNNNKKMFVIKVSLLS